MGGGISLRSFRHVKERGKGMKKSAAQLAAVALAVVLVGVVLIVGVQGRAQALEPRPPDALLKQGDRTLQEGRRIAYCWIRRCVDGFEDRYPSAVLVEPGTQLRIRLTENRPPKRLSLTTSSSPDGPTRRIDTTLRRVVRDGRTVAWDAYFRLERPDRQHYMEVFGVWRDDGGRERGDAFWQFHVKTGP